MPLARPRVENRYRTQEINLQPFGNTISVEADSDNPFEDTRDVEIFTQASGGMAGPDSRMRSRGVLVQRPQHTQRQGGQVRAFRVKMDAAHPGFMPGMGDLPPRRGGHPARISHNGYMPGMGDLPARPQRRRPARNHNGYMPGMGSFGDEPGAQYNAPVAVPAAAPAAGTPAWLQAIQDAGKVTAGVVQARYDSQTAASTAKAQQALMAAEQARADQMRSQSLMSSTLANMNRNKVLVYGLGAVAVAALGAAIFLKRKKSRR